MPKQTTAKRSPGRPKGARTRAGKNKAGAGPPVKYTHKARLTVDVEADVRRAFQLISPKRGDLNGHLRAALDDYLRREDIRARLEDVEALLHPGDEP